MSSSTRFCCYLIVLLLISISRNTSLDCSQYTEFTACSTAEHCSWTQLRCVCASTVNLDILFTISTSSNIGEDHFKNAIKPWLREMTEVGINDGLARVGWDIFSDDAQLTNISATTYNKMKSFINNIEFDAGAADLSQALQNTQQAFTHSLESTQKLNVIIMGSNPYKPTSKISEVCQYASGIKQMGIEVIFIGFGSKWKQARVDCLVGDAATHIIRIDSYDMKDMNASLPTIYDFICPTNTDIKITEIKPMGDVSQAPFVEFYNKGIRISGTLRFNGLINGFISDIVVEQASYLVVYDANKGVVKCENDACTNSVYLACDSDCSWNTNMNITSWNIEIMDDDMNSLDVVRYNSDIYWPKIAADYSYELEYLGYHNKYGSNYIRSCTTQGSPGTAAMDCTAHELKCQLSDECMANGDTNAFCSNSTCICNDVGFYPKQHSCYRIPQASDCVAYIVHNGTQRYTRFEFEGADTDMYAQYGVRYYQKGLTDSDMVTVIDVSRVRTESDLYFQLNAGTMMDTVGYVYTQLTVASSTQSLWISPKWHTNCTVITQTPTVSPTASPSIPPTSAPTMSPTNAPTWQVPKVYLVGDFCDKDRCNCFDKAYDCCQSGTNYNCSTKQMRYNLQMDTLLYQTVKIVPELFPYPTLIKWRLSYNDTANDSMDIKVQPMFGKLWINDTTSINAALQLMFNQSNETTQDSATFVFELVSCSTLNEENLLSECSVIYPSKVYMRVDTNDNAVISGAGAEKVARWMWIALAAGGALLLLLGLLLYRYFSKGRKQSGDYKLLTDEIEFQKQYNDEDIEERIKKGDISFNPLATGMAGSNKPHDPFTVEREKRELLQQEDIVEPDTEKQVFKAEMGQVQGRKTVTGKT